MLFEHMNNWKIRLQGKLFWQKTKIFASRCFTLPFVGIFHLKCLYQRKRDLELCAVLYSLHQPLLATGTEPTENTKQSFRHLRQYQHGRKLNDCKTTAGVKICLRLNKKQQRTRASTQIPPPAPALTPPLNSQKEKRHSPTQACSLHKRSSSEG